jgi:hypothetical protein
MVDVGDWSHIFGIFWDHKMAILKMGDGINKDRFRLNNSFSPLTPPMMLLILQKTDMEPLDLE